MGTDFLFLMPLGLLVVKQQKTRHPKTAGLMREGADKSVRVAIGGQGLILLPMGVLVAHR